MAQNVQYFYGMATWNKNISLRVLRTFCAAAEKESFRDAADTIYLTASAVSHQIKQLESELGEELFTRSARSLHLSKAGEALYDDLTPILRQLDSTIASHSSNQSLSTLRVSVQPYFANEIFVPRLSEFVELHPEIDIRVDTSDETIVVVALNGDATQAEKLFQESIELVRRDKMVKDNLERLSYSPFATNRQED